MGHATRFIGPQVLHDGGQEAWVMSELAQPSIALERGELERAVQLDHPEKILVRSGIPCASKLDARSIAALYGIELDDYLAIRSRFAGRARRSASELLGEAGFGCAVDRLPLASHDVIVAVGDSLTDDYQSWVEILRYLLELRSNPSGVRIINAGISGDTTVDVLRRLVNIERLQPTWIITLLGTNDARRERWGMGRMLLTHRETARNLARIYRFFRAETDAQLLWLTPPPVLEERIETDRLLANERVTWLNEDIGAKAELVRALEGKVVDLQPVFRGPALSGLLLPDGLHPSITGHRLIARTLVQSWTARSRA